MVASSKHLKGCSSQPSIFTQLLPHNAYYGMAASSKRLNGCSGLPLSLFGTVNENREGQNYSGARCALEKTQPEVRDFLVFLKENYVFMLGGLCVLVAPHLLNVFFCPRVKEKASHLLVVRFPMQFCPLPFSS